MPEDEPLTDDMLAMFAKDDPYNSTGLRKTLRKAALELITRRAEAEQLQKKSHCSHCGAEL